MTYYVVAAADAATSAALAAAGEPCFEFFDEEAEALGALGGACVGGACGTRSGGWSGGSVQPSGHAARQPRLSPASPPASPLLPLPICRAGVGAGGVAPRDLVPCVCPGRDCGIRWVPNNHSIAESVGHSMNAFSVHTVRAGLLIGMPTGVRLARVCRACAPGARAAPPPCII